MYLKHYVGAVVPKKSPGALFQLWAFKANRSTKQRVPGTNPPAKSLPSLAYKVETMASFLSKVEMLGQDGVEILHPRGSLKMLGDIFAIV